MFVVIGLLLSLTWLATVESLCPAGFSYRYLHGNFAWKPSCYRFVRTDNTWAQARKNCRKLGGDLVSIETSGENSHLLYIIKRYSSLRYPELTRYRNWGYWTGGNDLAREGHWHWAAGNRQFSYGNWYPGEPNNAKDREHCLHLRQNVGWKWNDMECRNEFQGSICEKPAVK